MIINLPQPRRDNGITMEIRIDGGAKEFEKIKGILEKATTSKLLSINLNGFTVEVLMYPTRTLKINNKSIMGSIDAEVEIRKVLKEFFPEPKVYSGRPLAKERQIGQTGRKTTEPLGERVKLKTKPRDIPIKEEEEAIEELTGDEEWQTKNLYH